MYLIEIKREPNPYTGTFYCMRMNIKISFFFNYKNLQNFFSNERGRIKENINYKLLDYNQYIYI